MLVKLLLPALFLLVARPAYADSLPAGKTNCPEECQRRAKAAFAFAKLKADAPPAATAAPMPKPVSPKVGLCPCGPGCTCRAGECPLKCPVVGVGGIAGAVARPQPRPATVPVKSGHYERRCVNGTCYLLFVED